MSQVKQNHDARETTPSIVIIGNTPAAWMTCAVLVQQYRQRQVDITLLSNGEPGAHPIPVSVLPHFSGFLQAANISERAFMQNAQASFKLADVFLNWAAIGAAHFQTYGEHGAPLEHLDFNKIYMSLAANSAVDCDYNSLSLAALAARADRFVHPANDARSVYSTLSYTWHFNPDALMHWLKAQVSAHLTVNDEAIQAVNITDNRVESVQAGQTIFNAQVFIDCSRDASVIGKLPDRLGKHWQDCTAAINCELVLQAAQPLAAKNLACDVVQVKPGTLECITPARYNTAVRLFADASIPEAQALLNFKNAFGPADVVKSSNRNGFSKQAWVGNCIALGQAAVNFNNPLISEIDLAWLGLAPLVQYSPLYEDVTKVARAYNSVMRECYGQALTGILLWKALASHTTTRNQCDEKDKIRDWRELNEKLQLFKACGAWSEEGMGPFSNQYQWNLLHGAGCLPDAGSPVLTVSSNDRLHAHVSKIASVLNRAAGEMPAHKAYLSSYLKA